MLNKDLLFKSFNGIDEELLLRSESNSYKTGFSRKKKLRIFAAAISAAIGIAILFVALTIYSGNGSSMDGYTSSTSSQEASSEPSGEYLPDNISPGQWEDNDIRYESGKDN